jgi:hypothetical protein
MHDREAWFGALWVRRERGALVNGGYESKIGMEG